MTIDIKALRALHAVACDVESTPSSNRHLALHDLADRLIWTGTDDPMRGDLPALLDAYDALEAAERERDRLREQGGELFLSGQVAKLREERDAAVAENDRLRNLPQSAFEAATMAAANATERQLREERDALQGILDDIASESGHCLLLDDEEHEAPTLPDWVRGIVKERDAALAELEACKAKLAALASYRIDHRLDCEFDPPNAKACTCGLDDLLAAAKEPTP